MEKRELLLQRLEEIGKSLESSRNALALLALGSCGIEKERLDNYSDLDFFVIVKEGYKERYIEIIDWLESVHSIGYVFRNTQDGYKLLYDDGVFCEFAVFEPRELKNIPFSTGSVIWRDENFDEALCCASNTKKKPSKENEKDYLLGEILTNLYVGLGRYHRGEKLSAFRFVQIYAVDRIVEMMDVLLAEQQNKQIPDDIFDKTRRIETKFPGVEDTLKGFMQGYDKTPEAAKAIMEFLQKYFEINKAIKKEIEKYL